MTFGRQKASAGSTPAIRSATGSSSWKPETGRASPLLRGSFFAFPEAGGDIIALAVAVKDPAGEKRHAEGEQHEAEGEFQPRKRRFADGVEEGVLHLQKTVRCGNAGDDEQEDGNEPSEGVVHDAETSFLHRRFLFGMFIIILGLSVELKPGEDKYVKAI